MINLYERDAADVTELLDLLAEFFDKRVEDPEAGPRLTTQLSRWEPRSFERTHSDRLRQAYKGDVVAARLRAIVEAIADQAGSLSRLAIPAPAEEARN